MKQRCATWIGVLAGLAASAAPAHAESFSEARASARRDLDQAIERLAEVREEIREEKVPLARELTEQEALVREKRRELEAARRARDTRSVALESLREQLRFLRDETGYVGNLLGEYVRSFEQRLHLAELARYDAVLLEAKSAMEQPETADEARIQAQFELLRASLGRIRENLGGTGFTGEAVMPDGTVQAGGFALVGPLGYFAPESVTRPAGIVTRTEAVEPRVVALPQAGPAIRKLVESGAARVPVDPTLGSALAIERSRDSLVEHIGKGGLWIWPILAFALLAGAAAVYKFVHIWRIRVPDTREASELAGLVAAGKREEAIERASKTGGPAGELLRAACEKAGVQREVLDEILYERILEAQPRLESLLPFIAVTAAAAPLLGLLGTVTGMIHTFELINLFGTGDPRRLASGISEALVTTEFGLFVAIPALIAHALLARRVQGILAKLEKLGVAFVNAWETQRKGDAA